MTPESSLQNIIRYKVFLHGIQGLLISDPVDLFSRHHLAFACVSLEISNQEPQ